MRNNILTLREVIKKLVPILTKKGLRVTQMGAEAYVRANLKTNQPEIVNIPSIGENATPDFIRAIQGFVDHEVAHVLLTDFAIYGKDPRHPNQPATKKFVNIHNIVEDTMIEREIVKIFPGAEKNLRTTRRYYLDNITIPALRGAKMPQEQYQYLLVVLLRALAGHEEMQEFMDKGNHWNNPVVKQFVDSFSAKSKQALRECKTTKETLAIAVEVMNLIESLNPPSQAEQLGQMLAQAEQGRDNEQDAIKKEPEENKPNEDVDDRKSTSQNKADKAENSVDDTKSENKDKDGSQSII